jgi:hypothetical protein
MQFSEMIDRVASRCKRPDKRDDIKDSINNAISYFTLAASFAQDLKEGTVVIDPVKYAQSFSIATNLPLFRRLKYLKRTNARSYITKADAQKVYDKSGCEQLDRWYRAGDNIVFKLSVLSPTLEYGYYAYPALLDNDADIHWMLDLTPMMIQNKALGEIFMSIGEPNDAQHHNRRAEEMFVVAKGDFEDASTPVSNTQ